MIIYAYHLPSGEIRIKPVYPNFLLAYEYRKYAESRM
jgi:hypothetical protein